jgi:hypothetical protein
VNAILTASKSLGHDAWRSAGLTARRLLREASIDCDARWLLAFAVGTLALLRLLAIAPSHLR